MRKKFDNGELRMIEMSAVNVMEMLADYITQEEAERRMAHYNPQETLSHEEVMESLGITQDELADVNVEVE